MAAPSSLGPHFSPHTQRALVIALLLSLALWNLPFGGFVLYPFKLLATWLHELSHGMVMLVTGAGFDHMAIYRDASGLAFAKSGTSPAGAAAIAAAGYMGTPVFGALFLIFGQSVRGTRRVLVGLAVFLAAPAIFYVSNDFGIVAGLIGAGAFALLAVFASSNTAIFIANFIAAQSCINAVLDIRTLFRSNLSVNSGSHQITSDAMNMAQATNIGGATLWAGIWLAWSFAVFYVALRILYLRQHRSRTAGTL